MPHGDDDAATTSASRCCPPSTWTRRRDGTRTATPVTRASRTSPKTRSVMSIPRTSRPRAVRRPTYRQASAISPSGVPVTSAAAAYEPADSPIIGEWCTGIPASASASAMPRWKAMPKAPPPPSATAIDGRFGRGSVRVGRGTSLWYPAGGAGNRWPGIEYSESCAVPPGKPSFPGAGGLQHLLVRLRDAGGVERRVGHHVAVGGEAHDHLALVAADRVDDAHAVDHRGHPGDEEASCAAEVQRVLRPRDVGDDHVDADGPSDPVEQ